ncbi:MAG: hypothetical protein ABJB86_24605 [Bacteroidota bacterium]
MRRRHRRVLFNLFAFSLLGTAIYLNMFRMQEKTVISSVNKYKAISKENGKINSLSKTTIKAN